MEMFLECLPGILGYSYLLGAYYTESQVRKERTEIANRMHWTPFMK